MPGGRSIRAQHLHFRSKPTRGFPLRLVASFVAVVVIVAVAASIRAATETVPDVKVQRVLADKVTLTGPPPTPAWPTQGEAAAEVQGLPSLGTSGPDRPAPIASVAKIMTAYVVLKDHPLSPGQTGFSYTVTATDVTDYHNRLSQAESVVPVAAGEAIDELHLLQALLVPSGNNIAAILAGFDAGSEAAFVTKMNSVAAGLGMSHTTYTDPSGLQPTTVSTAADQLVLASRAMADPVFAKIVAMTSVTLPTAGTLANFNTAVGTNGYIGIKTGSDTTAGGCVVFANQQTVGSEQVTILGVVLGQDVGRSQTATLTSAALSAATALVQSIKAAVGTRTVVAAGTTVAQVVDGSGQRVPARTAQDVTVVGLGGQVVPVTVTVSDRRFGHRVAAGQMVATVRAGQGPTVPVRTAAATPGPSITWRLEHLF